MYSLLNITEAKVWIRTSLDGPELVSKSIDRENEPTLATGWNKVVFDTPWEIPADCQGFYLGYSVLQKGYSYGIAHNTKPCPGGMFYNRGETGWEDLSDEYTLYLQADVEGSDLPGVNIAVSSCTVNPQYNLGSGSPLSAKVRLRNMGAQNLSSLDLSLMNGDNVLDVQQVTLNTLEPGCNNEYTVNFAPGFTAPGKYELTVKAGNPAEGTDVDPSDNIGDITLNVLGEQLQRMLLIEEFSTEQCPNCPAAATLLHNILARDNMQGRAAAVVHHAGYGEDFLTQSWDKEYTWFYNGGTFAPAFMVDRAAGDAITPVIMSGRLEAKINSRLDVQPDASLKVKGEYLENGNRIKVTVSGQKYIPGDLCANPVVTLWLTEDNVKSVSQAGSSAAFKHQHVARALNATYGEDVTFDGDKFEYTFTFNNIDSSWKKDDLKVVAALHNRKGDSPSGMEIINAAEAPASSFTGNDAINTVVDNQPEAEVEYFTLDGIKVNDTSLQPGIYVRRCGASVRKIAIK